MITVKYSCKTCGIVDRAVQVPARTTEDVVEWVNHIVGHCLRDDHDAVSPSCKAASVQNLKIPIPESAEFIGQQIE